MSCGYDLYKENRFYSSVIKAEIKEARFFDELPEEVQEDLIEWYNVADPDDKDKSRLYRLVKAGRFNAWDCPVCGDRVYEGQPNSWDYFQGVRQVDYTSYPGDLEKYNQHYVMMMCDTCRCHN